MSKEVGKWLVSKWDITYLNHLLSSWDIQIKVGIHNDWLRVLLTFGGHHFDPAMTAPENSFEKNTSISG